MDDEESILPENEISKSVSQSVLLSEIIQEPPKKMLRASFGKLVENPTSSAIAKKQLFDLERSQREAQHLLKMKLMQEKHDLKMKAIQEEICASQLKAQYYSRLLSETPFRGYCQVSSQFNASVPAHQVMPRNDQHPDNFHNSLQGSSIYTNI
uniref:Uncharacterized protein n=1 Tax=Romanomermis culicivorax TaxID=13658 RepID=A0A915KW02_ROMCU